MGIGVALARLLGPREFGAFAVSIVALLAVLSFNELGVSLAIVRWEGEPSEIAPTVTTISVVSSLIIYAGCFFGAPAFAKAMGAPAATDVIRVLSINVVYDGLVSTPVALMERYFRQDKKMIADMANNWIGSGTSIGLAVLHFGAMSLAIGRLAGATVAAVLFIIYSPEPLRFGFDPRQARALLHFGLPLAGASIIVFAVTNADQIVVGRLLGATALGYYALAFNLSGWPVTIFAMPIRTVAPALFSRLQRDRSAMRTGFLASVGLMESITLPVCLLISGAAVPLVHFVYGARWEPAAQALVWLGALAALRIMSEFIYDFFVVLARSRVVFTVQLVWLIVLVPALIAGTWLYGIAGAGMAEVVVALCLVLPWYMSELSRVGIQRRALLAELWLPLVAAAVVAVAAYAIAQVILFAFGACLVSGVVTLVVIGLLVYRMRDSVSRLRTLREGGEPEVMETPSDIGLDAYESWGSAPYPVGDAAQDQRAAAVERSPHQVPRPMPDQQPMPRREGRSHPMPGPHPVPGYRLMPGRPIPGQPVPGYRPTPGQPVPGRRPVPGPHPVPGQPVPGYRPTPGQPVPGQPVPGYRPTPGQPVPGQPVPGRSVPGRRPVPGPHPMPGQRPMPPTQRPPARPQPVPAGVQPASRPSIWNLRETRPMPVAAMAAATADARQRLRSEGRRFAAAMSETMPMPAIRDITGPVPMYREPIRTPIYEQMVQSMRLDPTKNGQRSHGRHTR
jgi:O-antigen/teichoic acid export membrane protein